MKKELNKKLMDKKQKKKSFVDDLSLSQIYDHEISDTRIFISHLISNELMKSKKSSKKDYKYKSVTYSL